MKHLHSKGLFQSPFLISHALTFLFLHWGCLFLHWVLRFGFWGRSRSPPTFLKKDKDGAGMQNVSGTKQGTPNCLDTFTDTQPPAPSPKLENQNFLHGAQVSVLFESSLNWSLSSSWFYAPFLGQMSCMSLMDLMEMLSDVIRRRKQAWDLKILEKSGNH